MKLITFTNPRTLAELQVTCAQLHDRYPRHKVVPTDLDILRNKTITGKIKIQYSQR
jgi:hypothetical protein